MTVLDELYAWPNGPRFVVSTLSGHRIDPASTTYSAGGHRAQLVSAYVLDRAYAHRVVASFVNARRTRWPDGVVAAAEAYAAELNALEQVVA